MKIKSLIFFVLCCIAWCTTNAQNDTVVFSASGGFYDEVFQLELSNNHPQYHIRYTTNGCEPTKTSPCYTAPLQLDESLYSTSRIFTILDCPEEEFRVPDSILRCIVIRAAVFDEVDSCIGPVATHSYMIKDLGCDLHGLPVVSLCADSTDLFDYELGIMVAGALFDPANPKWTGNYYQRGKEWERRCNVEFYETDNSGINQIAGLRTHGGNGRHFQQKAFKMYARNKYGDSHFRHRFFDTTPIEEFKHLVLKPFQSSGTGFQDHLCAQLAGQAGVEFLADRPVVLFLNGEYWGIYFLKEKADECYLESHFGVDSRTVTIMAGWWGEAENGTPDFYKDFYAWMAHADLSDPQQFAHADSCLDIDNIINYYIMEMFVANYDWPANNVRFWRTDDGKFRWIFFDGDSGLTKARFDVYGNATYNGEKQWPSSKQATLFFRKLRESDVFNARFAKRFNELMSTAFAYENTKPIFDRIKTAVVDEAERQIGRFGLPEIYWPKDYADWMKRFVEPTDKFLKERPRHNFLSLPKPEVTALECHTWAEQPVSIKAEANAFGPEEVQIYNLEGKCVFSQCCLLNTGSNVLTVRPSLPAGLYLLKVGDRVKKIFMQ